MSIELARKRAPKQSCIMLVCLENGLALTEENGAKMLAAGEVRGLFAATSLMCVTKLLKTSVLRAPGANF